MAANYEKRILAERKRIHTTVFDVAFSPCGNFFAACNNFGSIAVYSLLSALAQDASHQNRQPIFTFDVEEGPIYTLLSTDTFLISGGSSEISGWRWDDILEMSTTPSWKLSPPLSNINPLGVSETNALAYDKENNTLFSGCGDNNVYTWDLEMGICKNTFKGHEDYIHCLALRDTTNECISGSEDGSVRFWDCRLGSMTNKIEPYKDKNLNRPKYGNWIGCVAVDSNKEWMVCGGGPSLSVWHLRSMTCTSVLDTPNSAQQTALFHEDTVITAGTEASVFHWQVNGDLRSQIPCTPSSVYALRVNSASPEGKILLVGGTSSKIDTYINYGYKAFSFDFV
ncbi:THO complex subunit 6 homolog [Actinia tenebrosa]|uniref:THO complex subunit 6 homolog n=1 Tax=Actinia tenebrosa TaxID=6105 RepID=A0A6P8I7M6_ACTTE|nr:THO complex subunit 6 homolog [Actinia tenebrosa]